jgi:hypothetical protein
VTTHQWSSLIDTQHFDITQKHRFLLLCHILQTPQLVFDSTSPLNRDQVESSQEPAGENNCTKGLGKDYNKPEYNPLVDLKKQRSDVLRSSEVSRETIHLNLCIIFPLLHYSESFLFYLFLTF